MGDLVHRLHGLPVALVHRLHLEVVIVGAVGEALVQNLRVGAVGGVVVQNLLRTIVVPVQSRIVVGGHLPLLQHLQSLPHLGVIHLILRQVEKVG